MFGPAVHRTAHAIGDHDCVLAECRAHECRPYAASSIRQIHAILSGAFAAAVRWGLVPFNPMPCVKLPAKARPKPNPPSPDQLAHRPTRVRAQLGVRPAHVGIGVTGSRRGEVVALQWNDLDRAKKRLRLDGNWVRAKDGLILKDPKDHQVRHVSLDEATVELFERHRADQTSQLAALGGLELTSETFLFSAEPDFSRPRDPSTVIRRYRRIAAELGIDTRLKDLRHYSATELLSAGVDLRTVAGRLDHADGTTTPERGHHG